MDCIIASQLPKMSVFTLPEQKKKRFLGVLIYFHANKMLILLKYNYSSAWELSEFSKHVLEWENILLASLYFGMKR